MYLCASGNFQSHYGLILSVYRMYNEKKIRALSIPLWSDFILTIEIYDETYKKIFQSHYGLILSANQMWQLIKQEETFNPTMVWFYRFKN